MKRIGLTLVGVVCVSLTVLAGTVITNDTGEAATGLRVTFSSPVLITSFGDALTSIYPQMLSHEFVFSGGTVKPWDCQWFNYAPATASVVQTEWLTGAVATGISTGEIAREGPLPGDELVDVPLSAPTGPAPYSVYIDGGHASVSDSRCWGNAGSKLNGAKAATLEDGTFRLYLELSEGSSFGSFEYVFILGYAHDDVMVRVSASLQSVMVLTGSGQQLSVSGSTQIESDGSSFEVVFHPNVVADVFSMGDFPRTPVAVALECDSAGRHESLHVITDFLIWQAGMATADELSERYQLRLTYEEIMAAISEYPGPEESVYEPAEDEAIWLTDLEGHADIYDNDSIRINYASWFDESQVSRVEIFRNGIKMRSLPDMASVLTNEQMKTFDGNPFERAPASAHTDHAIWGYEFAFSILDTSGEVIHSANVRVKAPFSLSAKAYAYDGVGYWYSWGASDDELRTELEAIRELGFSGFSVRADYLTPGKVSTDLGRIEDVDLASYNYTATDEELARIFDLAEEVGLDVEFGPELAVHFEIAREGTMNRGAIAPSDVSVWFRNYGDLCTHLAELAGQHGVDTFVVGVELNSMEKYEQEWEGLISRVREVFDGEVTYADNTTLFCSANMGTNITTTCFEQTLGEFWDALDLIEMNMYPVEFQPAQRLETQADQRFSVIVERLIKFWAPAIAFYREEYPSVPLAIGEMGTQGFDGQLIADDWVVPSFPVRSDTQEHADIWAAYVCLLQFYELDSFRSWSIYLGDDHASERRNQPNIGLNDSPALLVISAALDGNQEAVAPLSGYRQPLAGPTWEDIPYTYSYRETPAMPAEYTVNGQSVEPADLSNWGLEGCDLKGVKVACSDEGLFVHWKTWSAVLPGAYSYVLHLWHVPTRRLLAVSVTPEDASASASLLENGQGTEIVAYVAGLDGSTVTVWIPDPEILCSTSGQSLQEWDVIPLLQFEATDLLEFFELPLVKEL